jgi:MFS family permease
MLIVGLLFAAMYAVGLQEIPPILELLVADLGLTYAQAGSLMTVFSLPGFLVAILWGVVITKYGSRKMGALSIFLFSIGSAVCFLAPDYLALLVGRTIMGLGAQAFPIIAASTISEWFIGREIGLAMGVYTSSIPLGTIVAIIFYGPLGLLGGWRLPLLITTLLGVLLLVGFVVLYRPAPALSVHQPLSFRSMKTVFYAILPLILGWLCFQGAGSAFTTFALSYFLGIGYPLEIASLYGSAWMLLSLFLSPVIGGLFDRRGNIVHPIMIGGILIIIAFGLVITLPEWSLVAMITLSFGATLGPVSYFAIMPRILDPKQTKLGYSLLSSGSSIGFAIGPIVAGSLRDLTGNYVMSFVGMAVFMILTMLTSLPLYRRKLPIPKLERFSATHADDLSRDEGGTF